LIQQIQTPPVTKVGVMDLDTFYPAKDRFGLAMALNHLVASPDFQAWLEGEPLDIERLLHTGAGKPRVSIFSISHLSDAERMFFVSLLLNQMVSWVRTQSGTTSLRALLYMDEIFGYFPPVANPPSKKPLLTLLKQARAYGVGVVLATQNPVDLDYKGLGNTGTWFIGRLQTDRDKMRVLDGLEGAAGESGSKFDRQAMERILAGLGTRVFLMNNAHEDRPVVFQTRWTLSYLRGPLARPQIKALMDGRKEGSASDKPGQANRLPHLAPSAAAQNRRPVLPPDITQYFLPVRGAAAQVVYRPALIGAAQVHFIDAATGADTQRDVTYLTPIAADAVAVNWDEGTEALDLTPEDLESEPAEGAQFAELPPASAKSKNYAAWSKAFAAWLFRMEKLELFHCPELGAFSNTGESERDFRVRLQQAAREERDRLKAELHKRYQPKFDALSERRRRAEQAMQREQQQSQSQTLQTAIAVGTSVFGALFGRKTISVATIGRAASAARAVSRSRKESQDIDRAGENVGAIDEQIKACNDQLEQELAASASKTDPVTVPLETKTVRPKKTNITVRLVSLAWNPHL
ncbi:MAG: type IV secretory system conjugative DNA transfer family protein, partial [Bryobacteraceae bacterium]